MYRSTNLYSLAIAFIIFNIITKVMETSESYCHEECRRKLGLIITVPLRSI